MKPVTSNLASSNPTRRKSGCVPGLEELPEIWGFRLIFLQRLKLATSNLVHRGKSGGGLGVGERRNILGSPKILLQWLGVAT